jgi:hypothetical protein
MWVPCAVPRPSHQEQQPNTAAKPVTRDLVCEPDGDCRARNERGGCRDLKRQSRRVAKTRAMLEIKHNRPSLRCGEDE